MRALAMLFVALLLVGCGSQPAAPAAPKAEVTFAKDVQPILSQTCMPCHAGGKDARGSYDLTSYAGVMGNGLDSIPDVIPGNADSSFLYLRVNGVLKPQMPKERPPLSAAQLATIKKWIDGGAKNN
jgi:hypothetical protein